MRKAVESATHAVGIDIKVEARIECLGEGVAVSSVPREEGVEVALCRILPVAEEEHVLEKVGGALHGSGGNTLVGGGGA